MNEPLKIGDTVWYVGSNGQKAQALPEDCTVKVIWLSDYGHYVRLENGVDIDRFTLRCPFATQLLAFRSKEHWMKHVETTRAWTKLLSRMQMHDQQDMEPFTVADIEAAELAIFGNLEA